MNIEIAVPKNKEDIYNCSGYKVIELGSYSM